MTLYAPFLRQEQTALIPWMFGYLGLISNSASDKITSIIFVRGDAKLLPLPLQQLLAVHDLIDGEGTVSYTHLVGMSNVLQVKSLEVLLV